MQSAYSSLPLAVSLPRYPGGHRLALLGVGFVHLAVAALALQPEPPLAIPPQQVIRIAMVAPGTPQAQPARPVETVQEAPPKIAPKPEGMRKTEPIVKPERKPEPVLPKAELAKPEPIPAPAKTTTGLQSPDAAEEHAAVTEPTPANYLNNPPPEYPRQARRRKQQGTVMLDVQVQPDGNPKQVRIAQSSGYAALDKAAQRAVIRWRFIPARRGSEVVEASVVVPVEFRIN